MKCDECGGLTTTERSAVRRYEMGGLPHVELHGVEVTTCTECGKEEIAIPRIGQLHRVLAEGFVKQQRMLASVEVRFLRKHIGLATADFAQMVGVTRETVCRWEKGAKPMGVTADRFLRLLVVNHEPSECYAVDDLLRELTEVRAPAHPSRLSMRNSKIDGWRPESRKLAKV